MKQKNKILYIVIAVIVVLLFARNFIVKSAVQTTAKAVTGLDLKIKKINIGLFSTKFQIKDLKLYNPKGFEEEIMVDLPEVYIDYHLRDIITGNIHLNEIRFDLNKFAVVKSKDDKLNIDALTSLQQGKEEDGKKEDKSKSDKKSKDMEMQIDKVHLKIGEVVYSDYSGGGEPKVKSFKMNLDEEFYDVTNPNQLVRIIVFKVLTGTTIGKLVDFDISGLQGMVSGSLKDASAVAEKALGETKEQAEKAISETKESLKGLLKNPLGN